MTMTQTSTHLHIDLDLDSHRDPRIDVNTLQDLDNQLSNRHIDLDPSGYFIIYLDRQAGLICAEHYTNDINEKGVALDPETGLPLSCQGSLKRTPTATYRGRTAKELGIEITEKTRPYPLTRLDHALYLGREFVRAELALITGKDYVQD
jgi:dihydropteroate synthase